MPFLIECLFHFTNYVQLCSNISVRPAQFLASRLRNQRARLCNGRFGFHFLAIQIWLLRVLPNPDCSTEEKINTKLKSKNFITSDSVSQKTQCCMFPLNAMRLGRHETQKTYFLGISIPTIS